MCYYSKFVTWQFNETNIFHNIEDKLGILIRKILPKLMLESLKEEVPFWLIEDGREVSYIKWLACKKKQIEFFDSMYNMGWSKRSSGTRYNNKS